MVINNCHSVDYGCTLQWVEREAPTGEDDGESGAMYTKYKVIHKEHLLVPLKKV